MPELRDSNLGTPPDYRIAHAIQRTGSRLVGDRFLASYLADCIRTVASFGEIQRLLLAKGAQDKGMNKASLQSLLDQAEDNQKWAVEQRNEDYHRTNVLAFLSLWAAQEAGNENIAAAILGTIRSAAVAAAGRVRGYDIANWPWAEEDCLDLAQKLDGRAKAPPPDGGWNACGRLVTLFGWLGVELNVSKPVAEKFNEASMIRNVLLHRYGRLGSRDLQRAPHLSIYQGKGVQITRERLSEYYQAVIAVHLALDSGVQAAKIS